MSWAQRAALVPGRDHGDRAGVVAARVAGLVDEADPHRDRDGLRGAAAAEVQLGPGRVAVGPRRRLAAGCGLVEQGFAARGHGDRDALDGRVAAAAARSRHGCRRRPAAAGRCAGRRAGSRRAGRPAVACSACGGAAFFGDRTGSAAFLAFTVMRVPLVRAACTPGRYATRAGVAARSGRRACLGAGGPSVVGLGELVTGGVDNEPGTAVLAHDAKACRPPKPRASAWKRSTAISTAASRVSEMSDSVEKSWPSPQAPASSLGVSTACSYGTPESRTT